MCSIGAYNAITAEVILNNGTKRTFNERVKSLMEELHLPQMNLLPCTTLEEPPWLLPSVAICTDEVVSTKNEYGKNITRMLFEEHFRTLQSDSLHVFTVSSKKYEGVGSSVSICCG